MNAVKVPSIRARIVLAGVLLIAGALAYSAVRGGGGTTSGGLDAGLNARTVETGGITVKLEPVRVDASGAEFRVTLDTHSGDLGMTVSGALEVGGVRWEGGGWSGDGPGGHHRGGRLTFETAGPARGEVVLTISGFDPPVVATWNL